MSARLDIWLILGCWIVFAAYWAIAAIGAKPNLGVRGWRREGGLRLALIVLTLLLLRVPSVREALRQLQRDGAGIAVFTGAAGVALCALGMTLAIWARIHLGRNWGVPMSRKEDPELVTTGPYGFIRHPIYLGILLAMLGSTLGASIFWLLPLILFGGYFVYSARNEEILMLAQFPQQYSAYRQRTKMLLPFLF